MGEVIEAVAVVSLRNENMCGVWGEERVIFKYLKVTLKELSLLCVPPDDK